MAAAGIDQRRGSGPEPDLEHDHDPRSVRQRIASGGGHGALSDAVLGAMDGSITTFTIVTGAVGGGLSGTVVTILGLAKIVADALSMAVSNYLGRRSEAQEVERARAMERRHIARAPEGEREEIRQIFHGKGFRGAMLDEIVRVLARNPEAWIDTMIKEELRLQVEPRHPLRAAAATFFAFLVLGSVPLAPFLALPGELERAFAISAAITFLAFVLIGGVRARALELPAWRSVLETCATGTAAALVAYGIGYWLRHAFGVG